ncbi:hypothetical protein PoB_002818400 [Plakobranchus ocellatus]|uniref:Uncharacterized protein n=1 Tax=Plakobranchus ocellatus TaxID=259542 RepID=A0AAV4A612_9GAST|nr:hypothetical protein PoB_002818400 [Plakobranchus ocellatus]
MPFFELSKVTASYPTLCEVTYDLEKRCVCDVHEKSVAGAVSRDLPATWTRSVNHVTGSAQASCTCAGHETVSLYSGPSSFYDMLKNYYWDNSYNQGGSPRQTPLPVRPNTTLTIYTSQPHCAAAGADNVGGSAPGFGHSYYSRRAAAAAVANNLNSERDSFLPSLFRGGVDTVGGGGTGEQMMGGEAGGGGGGGGGGREERSRKAKLRWVDALNTWIPEKKYDDANDDDNIADSNNVSDDDDDNNESNNYEGGDHDDGNIDDGDDDN